MNKAKSVCQQIFLYLLLALSVASTVCSAILFRTSSLAVENKEFIDTAIGSVDKAHELLEQRDIYASMLIGSIIAVLVCMLLIFCGILYVLPQRNGALKKIHLLLMKKFYHSQHKL